MQLHLLDPLFPDHTQGPSCICLLQDEGLRADLPRKQCLGEAPFPVWPTVCISLCHQSGPFWNSCNHSTNIYLTLSTNPVHVAYLSLLCPLSLWLLCTSHSELTHKLSYEVLPRDHTSPWTGLHVSQTQGSMYLSPFLQTFPEDMLCAEPYAFFSLSTTQRFLHLSGYTCPILPVSVLCLLNSLIFLSPSLTVCISFKGLSILVTLFPSLPPHAHPKCVLLSRPGLSLGTSLHPSSHMGLTTIVSLRSAGLSLGLSLFAMLLSQSLFLSLSLSSSLQNLFSLAVYTCYSQSLSLSLCLACPLSISLLYYIK